MKMNQTGLLLAGVLLAGAGWVSWSKSPATGSAAAKRTVTCYQDSMHPWIKSGQPGKCTICGMDLTPIYEGEKGFGTGGNLVVLSSNQITVLAVQAEEVKRQPLARLTRVAGTLEINESRKTIISAPAPCRVQALAVPHAGVEVEAGQKLITLFSPELVQKRAYLKTLGATQSGMSNPQGETGTKFEPYASDLMAPHAGTVLERNVYPGQYVVEGEKLLTLVDASVLWFRFDVYERQLPWFAIGQQIEVTVQGLPGQVFPAVIAFLEPSLNDTTRTVKVRADVTNPLVTTLGRAARALRFGMYAEGRHRAQVPNVLAVPRTAILFPGGSAYAYVEKGDGAYERHRLRLGRQGDQLWEVLEGLEEGDRVVTAGNVLLDAQAQFNQGGQTDEEGLKTVALAAAESDSAPVAHLGSSAGEMTATSEVAAGGGGISPAGQRALADFLAVADGLSRALAADNLQESREVVGRIPTAIAALDKTLGGESPWREAVKGLASLPPWPMAKDLAAARKGFLPFSTKVVELVQLARGQEATCRSLKVYHCPMAPKPGLWYQAKGPLRNPFYGAEMLTCGSEVSAPAKRTQALASLAPTPPMTMTPALTATPMAMTPTTTVPPETKMAPEPAMSHEPQAAPEHNPAAAMAAPHGTPSTVPGEIAAGANMTPGMPMTTDAPMAPQGRNVSRRRMAPRELATARESVLQAKAGPAASATSSAVATPAASPTPVAADNPTPMADTAMPAPSTATNKWRSRADVTRALAANKDEMWLMRQSLMMQAAQTSSVPRQPLTGTPEALIPSQRQRVEGFLAAADALSRALAADNLKELNEHAAKLAGVTSSLGKEFGADHAWRRLLQALETSAQWPTSADLAAARRSFLAFSSNTVELVKSLRKQEPAFADVKLYHCPMAPKPGLWMQLKGPLANPFYGAEMPRCGQEVTP